MRILLVEGDHQTLGSRFASVYTPVEYKLNLWSCNLRETRS